MYTLYINKKEYYFEFLIQLFVFLHQRRNHKFCIVNEFLDLVIAAGRINVDGTVIMTRINNNYV